AGLDCAGLGRHGIQPFASPVGTNLRGPAMTKTKKPAASLYSPHPSIQYARNVLAAMERKTGKTYEEWVKIAAKSGLPTAEERRDWLKEKHGLGTNTAWWIAEMSVGKGREAIE